MSRTASIRIKKSPRLIRIFPESWQAYMGQRLHDGRAVIVAALGTFLLLSLMTYHASDPSLNTASVEEGSIGNWMGILGAYCADVLIQVFGAGALALAIGLLAWALRLWRHEQFGPLWARFSALLAAAFCLSIAGATISGYGWLSHVTMGGAGGVLALNILTSWVGAVVDFYPHILVAVSAGALGAYLLAVGIALQRQESEAMVETFLSGGVATLGGASSLWERFRAWKNRDDDLAEDDDYENIDPVKKPSRKAKPKADVAEDDTEDDDVYEEDDEEEDTIQVVKPHKDKDAGVKKKSTQQKLNLRDASEWDLPPTEFLQEAPPQQKDEKLDEPALRKNAEVLQNVLQDYNIKGDIKSIHPGPVVTLYELEPAPGTKTSRVVSLADDIARSMSAVSVRAAVVPGRNVIGIELPNKKRQTVYLRELMEGGEFEKTQMKLPLVLGKDIGGHPVIADLTRMPHLLVAGTTGSGKSVAVNTMILSLLYAHSPDKCRFIMIDPKMLELSVYDDIPHLLSPVVTEPGKAIVALKWTVQEMENRYRNMSKLGVRNIEGYNTRIKEAVKKGEILMRKVQTGFDPETGKPVYEEQPLDLTELPYIVVVVDEFADLMLVAGKDVENAIQRLAQMARAAGIHLIMATQRPSVDVITGVIKANFPTRISFQVTSKIDSRTILGEGGAETLLGMGDMLYMAAGGRIIRVHGPFVSDREVEDVVKYLKAQGAPAYLEEITDGDLFGEDGEDGDGEGGQKCDELYDEAVAIVAREGKASTSFIQRHLQIGYNRAARIIEHMEKEGVVSKANRVGKREVLVGQH